MSTIWDFALEDGDLAISDSGQFETIEDLAAVGQRLGVRLKAWAGEWFLDTTFGVGYREAILVKSPNEQVIAAAFKKVILGTPGITKITSFQAEIERATRSLTVTFTAQTPYGAITATAEQNELLPEMLVTILGPAGPLA